ncbi:hypothetical protein DER46DRAFT_571942 [Fusarium sp. MPI-SDFR-AT-0072]|nr:hypothetical protein DER46DRAFT_571942 [Fusarium sp. MPI-SDFR-AT-0072]
MDLVYWAMVDTLSVLILIFSNFQGTKDKNMMRKTETITLLLVTRLELDVSTLEITGSYDNRARLTTAAEKIQSCSRLYLEAFAKSEQSISKLSNTAWELASSCGSLHRVTELFRKRRPAVTLSSFRDEWERVHRHLTNVEQHARASFESWTCLLSFIQEFESFINNMITDNKSLSIHLTEKLEDAKAEIKTRRYESYRTTLDNDIENETRDLETESELLTQKHRLNTTIGQTLQDAGSSLAGALGAIQETHDSYRAMFERFNSIKEDKIDRLHETINRISYTISMDESYHRKSTTDQWQRESKDVTISFYIEKTTIPGPAYRSYASLSSSCA